MLFGSLFTGVGGIDLGLERAGMSCSWQVEIDPDCNRVLERHWPDVLRVSDVKGLNADIAGPVDLIAGGFPCQPVSTASGELRKGIADERWLWPEFYRVIQEFWPRYVFIENVRGLVNEPSFGLRGVLGDLAYVGYDAEWQVVPAASLGSPQLRNRLVVVAHSRDVLQGPGGEHAPVPSRSSPGGHNEGRCSGHSREGCVPLAWEPQGPPVEPLLTAPEAQAPWPPPPLARVADGVSPRLDALRHQQMGNAVVPPWAEWVGRCILRHAEKEDLL